MGVAIESAVCWLMSGPKEEMAAPLLPKLVGALLGVWLLFGCLPIFAKMVGYNFLPSTEWISTTSFPGLAAGLATAAFVSWAVLKGPPNVSESEMAKKAGILAAPFLSYVLGKNAAVIAVPMVLAMIVGHHVELPFTVVRADHYGDRRCRSPVEFQGLPFFFDRICGVPNDFRLGLTPGGRILVIGRGTSLGVYAERLRTVD
jgi:hypothetical protein